MAIDPLDFQKTWLEPTPNPPTPPPAQQTFLEPTPNPEPPAPPPAPYVPMPTVAEPIVKASNLPPKPPMPVPVTEDEKASFINAARIAAREGVVPADKPYGWARQDKDGNLLYVTPDGEKRWVPPEEVYLAAEQGMKPMSNVEEFQEKRFERRQGVVGEVKAGLIQMADWLSGGQYRKAQRKQGMNYEELLKSGTPQTYEVPSEGQVGETFEEQEARKLESPIGTAIGSLVGVAASIWNPLALARALPGAAGQVGARLIPSATSMVSGIGMAGEKLAGTAGRMLSEGAALGLGGAVQELSNMPDRQYEQMSSGDIAAKLATDATVGAAINSAFALVGLGVGTLGGKAKNWFLKRSGVTEEQFAENIAASQLASASMKTLNDGMEAMRATAANGTAAQKAAFAEIEGQMRIVRKGVESGLWNTIRDRSLQSLDGESNVIASKIVDLETKIKIATNIGDDTNALKAALGKEEARLAKLMPKIQLAEANMAVDNALQASGLKQLETVREPFLGPWNPNKSPDVISASPADRYSAELVANGKMLRSTHAVSSAIPGAGIFGQGMSTASAGVAGYILSGGNTLKTLVAAAIPSAVRSFVRASIESSALKGVPDAVAMLKAAESVGQKSPLMTRIAGQILDIGPVAWKLIGAEAARRADDVVEILSEDEKNAMVKNVQTMVTPSAKIAFTNGLIQAGMEPETARAIADTRMDMLGLLITNKDANRVDWSKLLHAVKSPQGAIGRIAKGKATKQDMMMFKMVFPGAISSMKLTAQTILGSMKPSDRASPAGQVLTKMAGNYAPGRIGGGMSSKLLLSGPKGGMGRRGAPSNLGKRAFGGMATSSQALDQRRT